MLFRCIERLWQQLQTLVHGNECFCLNDKNRHTYTSRGSGASTITTPTLTPTHIQVSSTVGSADAALGTFKFCIPRHDMLFNI